MDSTTWLPELTLQLMMPLLVVLTPLVLVGFKHLMSALDTSFPKWLLPALAPVVGVLLDFAMTALTNLEFMGVWAAVFGALGVWARELIDQMRKNVPQTPAP